MIDEHEGPERALRSDDDAATRGRQRGPRRRALMSLGVAAVLLALAVTDVADAQVERSAVLPPVAQAGVDQSVASLAKVTLDGSASTVDVGGVLTWSQTGGPAATLDDVHATAPTFDAPEGPTTLTFELSVTDGGGTSTDEVAIEVKPVADHFTDAEFIAVQYQDFLGRPPTPEELDAKLADLASGAVTRVGLVEALLVDPAFTQPLEGAVEAYESAFGRLPDREGLRWWIAQRRQHRSVADLTDHLMDSHEYAVHDGLLTDGQYVETLYEDLLGRPADPGGLAYWTHQLAEPTASSDRSYCGHSAFCAPCRGWATSTRYRAECSRRQRRRRRHVSLTIAYGREGHNHLLPLVLGEHADFALLHVAAPFGLLQQQLTAWTADPHQLLLHLLVSPPYGQAHGY